MKIRQAGMRISFSCGSRNTHTVSITLRQLEAFASFLRSLQMKASMTGSIRFLPCQNFKAAGAGLLVNRIL
jgi:hypothetical protein